MKGRAGFSRVNTAPTCRCEPNAVGLRGGRGEGKSSGSVSGEPLRGGRTARGAPRQRRGCQEGARCGEVGELRLTWSQRDAETWQVMGERETEGLTHK